MRLIRISGFFSQTLIKYFLKNNFMVEKYYIDTAIWRDFYEGRCEGFKPLGLWAFEFFRKVREEKGILLYSDIIEKELSIFLEKKMIGDLLNSISEFIQKVETKPEQVKEAYHLARMLRIPFADALHSILARDNNAVIITRDHHFNLLRSIADVKKPEELI